MIFLPVQCRMARAALGLGVRELAGVAKVSIDTVARFERGDELKERTIDALQRALEAAGVEFTNGDQPGVRLTKDAAARRRPPGSASKPMAATTVVRRQNSQTYREKTISFWGRLSFAGACHRPLSTPPQRGMAMHGFAVPSLLQSTVYCRTYN